MLSVNLILLELYGVFYNTILRDLYPPAGIKVIFFCNKEATETKSASQVKTLKK